MALQTTVEQAEGRVPVTIVTLDGELDGSSYEGVIETVRGVYEAGGRQLLLDLTGLAFISSSGLVALHSSLRLMRGEAPPDPEHGWAAIRAMGDEADSGVTQTNVQLCGTQDGVQKVLDRTGLGGRLPVPPGSRHRDRGLLTDPDVPDAVAAATPSLDRPRLERILAPVGGRSARTGGRHRGPGRGGHRRAGRQPQPSERPGRARSARDVVVDTEARRTRRRDRARGIHRGTRPCHRGAGDRDRRARHARPGLTRSRSGPSVEARTVAADALGTDAAELAKGRRQQRSILSLVAPDVPGYDLASHYAAAREIGGDFFELFRLRRRGHPLAIVIADVTGKGLDAALLMAFTRPVMHSALSGARTGRRPGADEPRPGRRSAAARSSSPRCAPCCNRVPGRVRHRRAPGHEPPLLVPGDGGPITAGRRRRAC